MMQGLMDAEVAEHRTSFDEMEPIRWRAKEAAQYERIRANTEAEWRRCLRKWRFRRNVYKASYVALLLLAVLAGAAASVFSLLVDVPQVLGFTPLVWAGVAGTIASSIRLLEAAVNPGEKGRFYDVLATEGEILLSDLVNETGTREDVVRLRDRFETVLRSAQEGAPRGKGMQHIGGMAKELARKESAV